MDFNNIREVVVQTFKKNYKSLIAMSFCVFVMAALSITLNYFLQGSIILSFAVIILPFFISMLVTNIKMKQTNGEFENKEFYSNYKIGFMITMGGIFRIFRSLIIALIIGCLSYILIFAIPSNIGIVDSSNLNNLVNAYLSDSTTENLEILGTYINESSDPCVAYMKLSILAGYGFGIMVFIILMFKNIFIFFVQSNFGCSKRDAIIIYKNAFAKIKKTYYRINTNFLWSYFLLFPLGFVGGASLASIWNSNLDIMLFSGSIVALLLCMPLLPIVVSTQDVLFSIFSPYFLVEAREPLLASLRQINTNEAIPEDQKEVLRKFYVDQIKQIDQISKIIDAQNAGNPVSTEIHDDEIVYTFKDSENKDVENKEETKESGDQDSQKKEDSSNDDENDK